MGAAWKIKKFLGLKFDLIDAYGEVLEKYPGLLEPISVLPASKIDIKNAILDAAFSPRALKDKEYANALLVSFIALANFQHCAPSLSKTVSKYKNAMKIDDLDFLVDSTSNPKSEFVEMGKFESTVRAERTLLGQEWKSASDEVELAFRSHLSQKATLNAPR
jgi:hypothetical protein